jgi:cold shock CspA family protein
VPPARLFHYQIWSFLKVQQQFTGTSKFWDADRAFGFIFRDESNIEDFVHISKLGHLNVAALQDGATRFRYDPEARNSPGRTMATNVQIID